jgi:myo-inositol-1(or 4)-monophosphatase
MSQAVMNIAVSAAHTAGELMRRKFGQVSGIPVARKARHDYVSEVDHACEAAIVREISRYYPDHAFLGEEGGAQGEGDVVWVIDPLDGTSNYLHGIPHFSVSIAQKIKGRTELGVIFDPMRDELYTTQRGRGAFLNKQRIRVSDRTELETAVLATAFPFRQRGQMARYARVFQNVFEKSEDIRRMGTASLDLAYVACGRLDGYYEFGINPWDVAAGALLVREAGGVVLDFEGKDDVEEAGSIVAAPYKIMTELQRIIAAKWKTSR